jgi:hypothetical protein
MTNSSVPSPAGLLTAAELWQEVRRRTGSRVRMTRSILRRLINAKVVHVAAIEHGHLRFGPDAIDALVTYANERDRTATGAALRVQPSQLGGNDSHCGRCGRPNSDYRRLRYADSNTEHVFRWCGACGLMFGAPVARRFVANLDRVPLIVVGHER